MSLSATFVGTFPFCQDIAVPFELVTDLLVTDWLCTKDQSVMSERAQHMADILHIINMGYRGVVSVKLCSSCFEPYFPASCLHNLGIF